MKTPKSVSYFPVTAGEQALLIRVREPDLCDQLDDLLVILDQVANARLSPADLEQATQLLVASRQGEALEARFDNLEARLKERLEKGLTEIEGRFSRRFGAEPSAVTVAVVAPRSSSATDTTAYPDSATTGELPREASVAFRIGSELVWGSSAAQFYVAVWRWLFQHRIVELAELPIQSGRSRYAVASEPTHPSGKAFFAGHEVIPGAWVEAHMSRADVVRRATRYLNDRGVEFEVVLGSD